MYRALSLLLSALFILFSLHPQLSLAARLATEERTTPARQPSERRPTSQQEATDGILMNFKDVDIMQIINLMSDLTGKNFLVDEKVRGKVTVIAPRPVSLGEAYNVFLSILEIQGFTVVPQGPIIKIIPSREVKESPLPTAIDGHRPSRSASDEFITQLIPLQYADANEIRGILAGLVSKESSLLAYTPTNTLILTEVASNISRLMTIIRALDVEAPSSVLKVISLQHAAADQMATSLQSALESLAQAGQAESSTSPQQRARQRRGRQQAQQAALSRAPTAPKIIADSRTNSLVVIATPSDMEAAEDLIRRLDIPTPEGRGQIHVYYLAHANAEELAQVLTAQTSEISRNITGTPPQGTTPQRGRTPTRSPQPASQTGATTGTTPLGITITADKPTNSLVIIAPPEAYTVLKEIIEKLDIRRSQVLVETLFAEVTLGTARNLGVEWRVIDEPNGTQVFAGSTGSGQTGVLDTLTLNPLAPVPGLLIGAIRNTIDIGGQEILNIPAVLRAFQSNSDVNILATPNLLTTDNEEAEIIIGEERPFLRTAQDTPSGGIVSTTRSFEFRDTGITLRITPQISQGKTVRLNLFFELTAFVSEAEVGAVTTTKRSTQTTVIVDDDQTIVIGGLIREDNNDAQTQIPCLGNVPLLGWAFKQQSRDKRKNNLLIFITPHILNTPGDIARITEHKRQQSDKAPEIEQQLQRNQPQENLELLLN
jgi:general secretion pathway protein D